MRSTAVSTRRGEEQDEILQRRLNRATKSSELPQRAAPFSTPKQQLPEVEDPLMEESLERLRVREEDIVGIVNNEDDSFRKLQHTLRKRGCVTNGFLQENLHLYVQHVKEVKVRQQGGMAA